LRIIHSIHAGRAAIGSGGVQGAENFAVKDTISDPEVRSGSNLWTWRIQPEPVDERLIAGKNYE